MILNRFAQRIGIAATSLSLSVRREHMAESAVMSRLSGAAHSLNPRHYDVYPIPYRDMEIRLSEFSNYWWEATDPSADYDYDDGRYIQCSGLEPVCANSISELKQAVDEQLAELEA